MPAGLAIAAEAEDPQSAVVAQASFWWRGRALPVEHGGIGARVSGVWHGRGGLQLSRPNSYNKGMSTFFYDYRTTFSVHDKVKYA
jgi:hypothetical protein